MPRGLVAHAKRMAKTRSAATPLRKAFFSGRVEPSRRSFLERRALRMVGPPVSDHRHRPRIDAWAKALAARFIPSEVPT